MPKITMYTVGEYNKNGLEVVLVTHNRIEANKMCDYITSRGKVHYISSEQMDLQKYLWLNKKNLTLMEIRELNKEE